MNFDEQLTMLAYGQIFTTPNGKLVLNDLRKAYGQRSSYVPNSDATIFHEGQRDVLLRIEALIAKAQTLTSEADFVGRGSDGNEYASTE